MLAFAALTAMPVLLLRWFHPLTSAFMLESRSEASSAHAHDYRTLYFWVDMRHISPEAALAVIASEDQQFPFHGGFDFGSMHEAFEAHEHGKRLRGASTISQQVAKNLFLWSGRSYLRKGLEAWFTILIEALWPKERILETYLNVVQLGRGVFGVEAASRHFFRKPAASLTRSEAALLAAVLPNPERQHVERPSRYVLSRRDWIMEQMRRLGGESYLKGYWSEVGPSGKPPAAKRASTSTASKR